MYAYCIDTSSLIAAWQERYPIEHFPKFWEKMDRFDFGGTVDRADLKSSRDEEEVR